MEPILLGGDLYPMTSPTSVVSFVIGRGRTAIDGKPAGQLGRFRALDGSNGAPVYLDLDGPHAVLVVGKRGYGKSYTLGVIAEELAQCGAISPVLIDPMGVFDTLAAGDGSIPVEVLDHPTVTPDSLSPRSWCALVGLSPESGAGALLWQATANRSSLSEICAHIDSADVPATDRRAAKNHVELARSWEIFDAEAGLDAATLATNAITVLDISGLDDGPMNAVVRAVGEQLYRARVSKDTSRLPWLLIDEAHSFFEGVAQPALRTILTRGRAPGVSLVLATQRPSAISDVGVSQSDVLISHRLTSQADIDALAATQPTYMTDSLTDRMPTQPGEVLIVDDSTETVHTAQIRTRETPHGGDSPSARDLIE